MKLKPMEIFKQLMEFWGMQTKKRKITLILVIASVIFFAVFFAIFINSNGYVVLYSGLDSAEAGQIVSRLNEMGINSKVEAGDTILVPKEDEARLKMTLSLEGYPHSTLNYDIFSNNSSFMTTDYEKRKYFVFQLQNRLQDAIKTIKGIDSAIVTINLPEENSFVLEEDRFPATASAVLDLAAGVELSSQQIKGIEELLAKSIPALECKNVAILNNSGTMLNNKYSEDSEGMAYTRLDLEKSISATIESKIMKLLQPVFGSDSIRISVNTVVDIAKKISENTIYSPVIGNSGIIASQDITKDNLGATSGTSTNTDVGTYQGIDDEDNGGSLNQTSSTSYLVSQTKEQIQRDGYEIKDISVAVLINDKDLTEKELQTYKQMVSFASGISIDKVIISNANFSSQDAAGNFEKPSITLTLNKTQIIYIAAAIGILIIVLIIVFIVIRRKRRMRYLDDDGETTKYSKFFSLKPNNEIIPGEIVLNETREQGLKKQIKDFSSTNPEIVAQLLRTWLKESRD